MMWPMKGDPETDRFWDARTLGLDWSLHDSQSRQRRPTILVERRQTETIELHPGSDDIRSVVEEDWHPRAARRGVVERDGST